MATRQLAAVFLPQVPDRCVCGDARYRARSRRREDQAKHRQLSADGTDLVLCKFVREQHCRGPAGPQCLPALLLGLGAVCDLWLDRGMCSYGVYFDLGPQVGEQDDG
jgi:hypothetical protein